jgi:hypothetical protein
MEAGAETLKITQVRPILMQGISRGLMQLDRSNWHWYSSGIWSFLFSRDNGGNKSSILVGFSQLEEDYIRRRLYLSVYRK